MASIEQLPADVGADEAGATGDEHLHGRWHLSMPAMQSCLSGKMPGRLALGKGTPDFVDDPGHTGLGVFVSFQLNVDVAAIAGIFQHRDNSY